jgi:GTPase SAR1 family protein
MRNDWERNESFNFPSEKPVWTYTALLLTVVLFVACLCRELSSLTPLQRYWIPTYLHANILPLFKVRSSRYRLLWIEHRDHQTYFPAEDEVQTGTTITADGYRIPLELTEKATLDGKQFVRGRSAEYDNEKLNAILNRAVYQVPGISDFFSYPLTVGALFLIGGLIFAIPADRQRALIRKHGRRIQGPKEVSAAEFNRRNQSDGVAFTTLEKPTIGERILRREWRYVRIPQAVEDNHFLIMGDSGSGKSSLVRQLLLDIDARQESAIVYDPALEYTGEFYMPERGDVILNPLDQRMPYWVPSCEIVRPAEALTVASALFPDTPKENPFFVEGPRKIFAYLLALGLTTDELIWCLCHEEELDRKLKGSELASLVYANAGQQRGGILASLSMVADSLKLLPTKAETTATWTAAEWSQKRRGWIFITSLPAARKQLRPLISMWLDVLILRLMNEGKRGPRPTWFVLDELSSLHHLPQLHTAITENRKSGNPLVLSFQGRSQLEALYGHVAEAMFSQPATKIFLRTSEPNSAQWISNLIGNVELERVRETRTRGQMPQGRESRSYSIEQLVKPLVMKEQISGLPKGYGFLKFGNLVVRLSFPYQELPKRHPDFLERPIQNRAALERQRATAGALGFGNGASTANGDTKRETTGAPPSNDLKPDSSQSQYLK